MRVSPVLWRGHLRRAISRAGLARPTTLPRTEQEQGRMTYESRTSQSHWTRKRCTRRPAKLKPETRHFIDGKFVASKKGKTFQTINPATGDVIAEVARGDASRRRRGGEGRAQGVQVRRVVAHGAARPHERRLQVRQADRGERAGVRAARHHRHGQADQRDAEHRHPRRGDDVPVSSARPSTRSKARSPRPRRPSSTTSCASRSASSAASCRGTIR